MNTPSPNSMKRDPGRGSAYLSFLKKRCRDFFFFCLLLGVYVAFITLTGIGCPIRFFIGISCPGCGMSRAVLFMPGAFITTTRSFLLTLLSGACYNGSILIKGGIYK